MQYEYEWQSVVENTGYPFVKYPEKIPSGAILDLSVISPTRVYLKTVIIRPTFLKFTIANILTGAVLGTATVQPIFPGTVPFDSGIGYITIGDKIKGAFQTINLSPAEGEFHYWCCNQSDPVSSINSLQGSVAINLGYNMDVILDNNTVTFVPELNAGKGKYCGEPFYVDAIYSINGNVPDDNNNINFEVENLMRLDTIGGTLNFSLAIDDDRLSCTRPGFKGVTGPTGGTGISGKPGKDAPQVCQTCETCDVSDVCCECDAVNDFCEAGDTI